MDIDELKSYCEVSPEGCWIWRGPICSGGRYGRVPGFRRLKMAHRLSFELANGQIGKGKVICHRCDNGLCINPAHLFQGTMRDNALDAVSKGRIPMLMTDQRGAGNANAKYTREFALAVRQCREQTGLSYQAIADRFGLKSKGHAHAIATGRIWQ